MREKNFFLVLSLILVFISPGCKKNKEEKQLTPLNAPLKYGETMSQAIKRAKVMDSVLYLKNKINTFHLQEGRYPIDLNELIQKGYIDKLPTLPEGMQYVYDNKTGNISVK